MSSPFAIMFAVVLALVLVVVVLLRVYLVHVRPRDVEWIAGTPTPGHQEAEVYTRYLQRHRLHRLVGGLFGAAFATVVGLTWYGSITIGGGHPLADLLLCTTAGIIIGALSAETFRLSEPLTDTVSASLTARPAAAHPRLTRVARVLTIAGVVVGGLVAVSGRGLTSLWVAILGVPVALVAEATQRAIAGRRRPVLSDRARVVDTRIRAFASRSVAWLQLAFAVLVAAWVVSGIGEVDGALASWTQTVLVLGGLVGAVVLLHRGAPRPRRSWVAPAT
ncbi:hypothetical protein [Cellulomonas sp. URHD0024]|uniref:hypothetical protein n=1 Tax=Cellulomonas sp. URHD0024 TaxID=1302620 RepID=UPI00041792DA|nr:hypothetical protein [Cellulomonas sp. URHD0024]